MKATPKHSLQHRSKSLFYSMGLSLGLIVSSTVFAQQQMSYTYNDLGLIEAVDSSCTDMGDIITYACDERE